MACCHECALAQERGEMPRGATCSPCAQGVDPELGEAEVPLSFRHAPGVIAESECPTLSLERVDPLLTRLWEQGTTDLEQVTLHVLRTLYPRTPDGRPIDWRKLSIDTATCLLELRRRLRARAAYVFAHHDEDVAARRWQEVRGGQ
jgi:hypothetical protein